MPALDDVFESVHQALVEAFGPARDEFEGLAPFDAMLAALLARSLGEPRWRSVLDGLRQAELLTPEALAGAEIVELRDAVSERGRPIAAATLAPLKNLARFLVDHHDGQAEALAGPGRSTSQLREELASIKGVGSKGADAILLHALKRPAWPVDRATYRVLARHGWIDRFAEPDDVRDLMVGHAMRAAHGRDDEAARLLADLAEAMGPLGRRFCRPRGPECDRCPLRPFLPEGGPRPDED